MDTDRYSFNEFLHEDFLDKKDLISFLFLFIILFALISISARNYIIFHSMVETTIIVISISISLIAINTYNISKSGFFMFLGIAYMFVNFFVFMHTYSISGINLFRGYSDNLTVQFHIVARVLESCSLLFSFTYFNKKIDSLMVFLLYSFLSVIAFLLIIPLKLFPVMYVINKGPTLLKNIFEYGIAGVFILSIFVLYKNKKFFHPNIYYLLVISICNTIIAEVIFSSFSDLYQTSHVVGHCFRLISCFFMYKAISETTLRKPYKALFYELSTASESLLKENIERKVIEDKLRESEERYRQVTELSPDAIILHSNFILTYANKSALKLLGEESIDDLLGGNILDYIHPDYREIATNRIMLAQENGETCPFIEEVFLKKDGTEFDVEATATAFPYDKTIVLSIIRDISERKKAEMNEKLLKEALDYDNLRTDFFANISHELRTPLNVIFGSIQLIELYNKQNCADENTEKYTKIMKQNSYRLLRLVNNLIDITRIDSGFYQVLLQNLDIVSVIEDITQSVVQFAANKSIELIFDTDVEEKIMAFDPDKMERILLNLLSNSVKFTNPGGSILVSLFDKKDKVIISIKDTGIGISKDKLTYIFERFRQVDKSLTRDHEGSGIGLSLVKSLVEMHNGTIFVESTLGEGSEFVIELPSIMVHENDKIIKTGKEEGNIETINIEFSDIYS